MPFRAPGSGLPRRRGLATTMPVVDAFAVHGLLAKPVEPGFPSTRLLARGGRASLNLGVVRRLLQPNSTRGHTRRAVDPRARVRLSPRYPPASIGAGCVGPSVRCHTASLRAAICTRRLSPSCSTCVDEASRGPKRSSKGALAREELARALLVALRAPGSPARFTTRPGRPGDSSHRPRLFLNTASRKAALSRESGCLPP